MNNEEKDKSFNKLFITASIIVAIGIYLFTSDLGKTFIGTIAFIFVLMIVVSLQE
ncbi:MAG: hypothetical protein WC603_04035 [Candidatus Paceibacterota bacterium]|jgi:hypothetical protein